MPLAASRRPLLVALVGLVALIAGLWSAGAVVAHAELTAIDPTDGEVRDTAPAEVVLTWSEPVSLTGGSARVLDDTATVVSGEARVEGTTLTIPLDGALDDGTYTVAWDVISQDSHPISGATVFHVGAPSTAGPVDVGGAGRAGWGVRTLAAVLTSLGYAGALVAVGGWWLSALAGRVESPVVRRVGALVERAAILGAVALVAAVPLRIARVGGGLGALRDNALLAESLQGPIGTSTLVTATALLVLAGLAGRDRSRLLDVLGAGAGLVALVGFTLEGHTRSQQPRWLVVSSDIVHLAAGAVWVGGIAALAVAFRARTTPMVLGSLVSRFSTLAVVAVGVVVAAGTGLALMILPAPGDVFTTGYGLALLTKVVLVVPVIAMGAYNRRRLVPAMSVGAATPDDGRRRLRRIVSVELAVLLAIVVVTSVLVTRSPVVSSATPPPATTAPVDTTTELALSGDAGTVRLAITPAVAGPNQISLVLRDPSGRPLVPLEPPSVELTEPQLDVGPLRPVVQEAAPGEFGVATDLPLAGTYDVVVRVRVSDFVAATAETAMAIG